MAALIDEQPTAAPPQLLVRHLHRIETLIDDLPAVDTLSAAQVSTEVGLLDRVITRLQARRLGAITAADRAALADRAGMTGTAAWVATQSNHGAARAAADTRLAHHLDEHPLLRAALNGGVVSVDHAGVITSTFRQLPEHLTDHDREQIETTLIDRARRLDPPALRRSARRILEAIDTPPEDVDAHEDQSLRDEEADALAKARLTLHDNQDGTVTGHFIVPTLAGNILKKVIQQIASPRRHRLGAEREGIRGVEAFAKVDWPHLQGLALIEVLEHLPTDHLSGKTSATVVVTIDHADLRANAGAAHTDAGSDLSASQARRIACNAGVLPVVLDGDGFPVDVGRTKRFFTEHQRTALATRYHACAARGCDRPYAWTELHHQDPWSRGGETNLDRAIPLCGHHHRLIHDPGRRHAVRTDRAGVKTVVFHPRT